MRKYYFDGYPETYSYKGKLFHRKQYTKGGMLYALELNPFELYEMVSSGKVNYQIVVGYSIRLVHKKSKKIVSNFGDLS